MKHLKSPLAHFLDHPASVGETYGEHFRCATFFGGRLLYAGLVCLIHAVLPFLFEKTASRQVHLLHDLMVSGRDEARARIASKSWDTQSQNSGR